MKIVYQGTPGAYSNMVSSILNECLDDAYIEGVMSFKDIFNEVENGNLGVVPIENSYAGSIYENFHYLKSYDVKIIGEYFLDINHCLVSTGNDVNKIKKVLSHPQALMQCEKYLEKHGIEHAPYSPHYSNTALAVKYLYENPDDTRAAVSSEYAANLYGLNILDKGIQDINYNSTRFLIVAKKDSNLFENNEKFKYNFQSYPYPKKSICFKTKDIPAALYKCLGAFSTRYINLTKIESLPSKDNPFEVVFWIDFQKDKEEHIINDCMEELGFFCSELRVIGDY